MSKGGACVYCGQAELAEGSRWSILPSIAAKTLGIARTYYELKNRDGFSWRELAEALIDDENRPSAGEFDRKCPFCRRGYVTRGSLESLYLDAAARCLGLLRTYLEVRGDDGRPSLSWRDLVIVFVEGDEATPDQVYYSRVEVVPDAEPGSEQAARGKAGLFGGFAR